MRAFGPVPSRRLGHSLGINNIPPKICTYSCVYCQIGKTEQLSCHRQAFYGIDDIVTEVTEKVNELTRRGTKIDYLTFVPEGEPTLDRNLGEIIKGLRPLDIKIAVITNGSLISLEQVREDLQKADLVSLKIDAVRKKSWLRTDRPHKSLDLDAILEGMLEFKARFKGDIVTETMLIKGKNESDEEIQKTADFLSSLEPSKAYISVPTRPPAVKGILPSSDQALIRAYQVFSERLPSVEYIIGYEGNEFGFTGDVERDLLDITAVHPMREEAVRAYVKRAAVDWSVITALLKQGSLVELEYQGKRFYMRKIPKNN